MDHWTDSYITSVEYTKHYYHHLNPLRLKLLCLQQEFQYPRITTACELGYGQGLSVNVHAAASDIKWYGTDFLPAHAKLAEEMAKASGADIEISGQSFGEFCARKDLPDFDYICLHGVWTWISSENREIIIDFLRRKLKSGGIANISYNTLPGWSNMIALRDQMMEYIDKVAHPSDDLVEQSKTALQFVNNLLTASPDFTKANPKVQNRLGEMQKQNNPHYLAHEFFNKNWVPMTFSSVHSFLKPAELTYLGSADYLNNIDIANLNKAQLAQVNGIADPSMRETARDFLLNTSFRRDIWIKGPTQLSAQERTRIIREQLVLKVKTSERPPEHISTNLGKVKLKPAIYGPVLDALATYQPRTIGEIEAHCKNQKISLEQIIQAILVLSSTGMVAPVGENSSIEKSNSQSENFNAYLLNGAVSNQEYQILSSPVIGGAIEIDKVGLLFIHALKQGNKTPRDCAKFILNTVSEHGQAFKVSGQPLDEPKDALKVLTVDAKKFFDQQQALLAALKII